MSTAKRTPDARHPNFIVEAVMSPADVPRAKVVATTTQLNISRRDVSMLCMERVFSMAYHTENATNSAIEKKIVQMRYDIPKPICSTSAAMVPKTATMATTNQYTQATYC